jgi:hypothetical protein
MKHLAVVLLAFSTCAFADDPARLLDRLRAAVTAGDWRHAKEISAELRSETARGRDLSLAGANTKLADDVLTWLPSDTETLLVAQQPFPVPDDNDRDAVPTLLDQAQGYAMELLAAAENERLVKTLADRTMQAAALTARHFESHPASDDGIIPLGMIAWQGCGFYSLPIDASLFGRPPDERIIGNEVWISHGLTYKPRKNAKVDPETFYSLVLRPNLLVVCNNRDFLSTVLNQMPGNTATSPRALPASLPEWNHVDRSQPFWAIRHFDNSRKDVDPSNPATITGNDALQASGMTAEFSGAGATARMLVIAGGDPWKQLSSADEFQGGAQSHELTSNVWEIKTKGGAETQFMSVFVLMAQLGFAVFL